MRRLFWAVLAIAATAASAWALPNEFIQEGVVLDAQERPLDGQHRLRVRIYAAPAGGVALFDEVHPAVVFFEGYYAIAIGSEQPLTASFFAANELYLGLSIDNGPELTPRTPLARVPAAFVAEVATNAVGDITPRSVTIGARQVISAAGQWVGDPTGLRGPAGAAGAVGPAGPQGAQGPAGPQGPQGIQGPQGVAGAAGAAGAAGQNGSADTPAQVLAKLVQVDGGGSTLDADRLDGLEATAFVRTAAQVLALLVTVDGPASGVDADLFDGLDSSTFVRTAGQVLGLLVTVDGAGSGVDADRLDGIDSTGFVTTAVQVRDLLATVDGTGSGVDADRLDGVDSTSFVTTAAQVRTLLLTVDGAGSGVDSDRLDGLDSTQFLRSDGNITIAGNVTVTGTVTTNQPITGFRVFTGANPPVACDAAARGMLYFDTDDSAFHGCNGTSWVPFGQADDGIARGNVEVSGFMGDTRHTPDGWDDLPGRTVTFGKARPDTVVRLTYQDTLGYHMVGHNDACRWRLVVDGAVYDRMFRTHSSAARGWRIQPLQLEWFLTGLAAGNHTYRIQVQRPIAGAASECLAGWPNGDTQNFIAAEEIAPETISIVRHFSDTRHTPDGWSDLPERTITVDKISDDSLVQVTYQDVLGYHMVGGHSWGCRWRLTMNGAAVDRPFSSHTSTTSGWRIDPRNLTWVLDDVRRGRYTFRIQVYRPNANSTSSCLAGWTNGDTGNSLSVRELARTAIALRRHMVDSRITPAGWTDIPQRELVHRKGAGTTVRVTYMDDIGYHMVGQGWGCRWRLTIDGNAYGRALNSHTSAAAGWRIDPMRMEWIVPGLPGGNHTYRVQLYRPDAGTTNECLAGWPDGDAGNLLMVQEVD